MATKPKFKKGQKVTWTSQAGGNFTTKTGVIVEVVKAGVKPTKLGKPDRFGYMTWHGQALGFARREVSYVVALLDKNGKPAKSQWKRYWPLTSKLSPVCESSPFVMPRASTTPIIRTGF